MLTFKVTRLLGRKKERISVKGTRCQFLKENRPRLNVSHPTDFLESVVVQNADVLIDWNLPD